MTFLPVEEEHILPLAILLELLKGTKEGCALHVLGTLLIYMVILGLNIYYYDVLADGCVLKKGQLFLTCAEAPIVLSTRLGFP